MGDVARYVIDPMTTLWPAPDLPNADAVLDTYERALAGYSNEVLDGVMDAVALQHMPSKAFPWPSIALIDRCCKAKAREIQSSSDRSAMVANQLRRRDDDLSPPTPEARARVAALMAEFRKTMAHMDITEKPAPKVDWTRVQRPAVERMQRESPNRELHTVRRGRLS